MSAAKFVGCVIFAGLRRRGSARSLSRNYGTAGYRNQEVFAQAFELDLGRVSCLYRLLLQVVRLLGHQSWKDWGRLCLRLIEQSAVDEDKAREVVLIRASNETRSSVETASLRSNNAFVDGTIAAGQHIHGASVCGRLSCPMDDWLATGEQQKRRRL